MKSRPLVVQETRSGWVRGGMRWLPKDHTSTALHINASTQLNMVGVIEAMHADVWSQ
jgi:hypothetical protein